MAVILAGCVLRRAGGQRRLDRRAFRRAGWARRLPDGAAAPAQNQSPQHVLLLEWLRNAVCPPGSRTHPGGSYSTGRP